MSAQLPGRRIHRGGKSRQISEAVPGQRGGSVIFTLDQHGGEQHAPRVPLTGTDPELAWRDPSIVGRDDDAILETSFPQNNQRSQKLLSARNLRAFVGVLLIQCQTASRVNHDCAASVKAGSNRRPERTRPGRRVADGRTQSSARLPGAEGGSSAAHPAKIKATSRNARLCAVLRPNSASNPWPLERSAESPPQWLVGSRLRRFVARRVQFKTAVVSE